MHAYNYCANNPVNFVDPLGMGWWPDTWPPPRGAEEDCSDYLDRKYNSNRADENEGTVPYYDPWSDISYFNFGHENPDKLFTTTEVAKQLNTNYNQEDKAFYDRNPKGDQSVEYSRGRSMFKLKRKLPLPFSVPMYLAVHTESVIGDVANEVYESGKFNEADKQQFFEFTSIYFGCTNLQALFGVEAGDIINKTTTILGAILLPINDKIGSPSPWGYGGTNMRRIKGGALYNPVPPWGRPPLQD